jgi:hypothetical protein
VVRTREPPRTMCRESLLFTLPCRGRPSGRGSVCPPFTNMSSRVISPVKGFRQPSGTNVFGGVDVSVVGGLITRAVPRPHRKRLALGDVAALRATSGRRKPAVDLDDSTTSLFGLVLDHLNEGRPSSVTNRPSGASILLRPFSLRSTQVGKSQACSRIESPDLFPAEGA